MTKIQVFILVFACSRELRQVIMITSLKASLKGTVLVGNHRVEETHWLKLSWQELHQVKCNRKQRPQCHL